ncbi:MAG: MarR family transcriptional regulator [Candidatus Dormibacteraeota bacterium]|nr:MarR family transcriptional regulator [Candidatus Dormibacteraeota bacterium]
MTTTPAALDPEVKTTLRAYLEAVALAEPIQIQLWEKAALTLAQLAVLRQLRDGQLPASRLARSVGRSLPSVSRMIDRLQERGLVSRHREGEDRRSVEIRLEPEGERLLTELGAVSDSPLKRAVESMTPGERRRLVEVLRDLVQRTRALTEHAEVHQ